MGQNKLLMPLGNKTILEHVLTTIKSCKFDAYLATAENQTIIDILNNKGFTTILNQFPENGQGYSIKLGVAKCAINSNFMFFTADQPFLTTKSVNKVLNCCIQNPNNIIVPVSGKKKGHPVYFPMAMREELLNLRDHGGGRDLIKKYPEQIINVDIDMVFDIDTPDEYKIAINLISKTDKET